MIELQEPWHRRAALHDLSELKAFVQGDSVCYTFLNLEDQSPYEAADTIHGYQIESLSPESDLRFFNVLADLSYHSRTALDEVRAHYGRWSRTDLARIMRCGPVCFSCHGQCCYAGLPRVTSLRDTVGWD
jgi:hypothetical protein